MILPGVNTAKMTKNGVGRTGSEKSLQTFVVLHSTQRSETGEEFEARVPMTLGLRNYVLQVGYYPWQHTGLRRTVVN